MSNIPIYTAEIECGLSDTITKAEAKVIAFTSQLRTLEDNTAVAKTVDISKIEKVLGMSSDNFDLYPVYDIMVTTGWNKNDDIFYGSEIWPVRHSPKDKPFNLEHEPRRIIGHIIKGCGVDLDYNVIDDNIKIDELPQSFHLLTNSVIYKHVKSRDSKLEQEIAELIEEIKRGEWFVSMEALFSNFDYGISNGSVQKVIARCEETAYLTKHLRVYGGVGEYNGYKIGRVLRNITFSGKGLVKNPANPNSFILNDVEEFTGVLASINDANKILTLAKEIKVMPDIDVAVLQKELDEVKSKLIESEKKLTETAQALDKANADVAEKATKVDELTKANEALVKSTAEITEAKTAMETELASIKSDIKKANRVSALVSKGIDKEEADKVVAEFDNLDDEKFEKIVAMQASIVEAKKAKCEDEDEDEDEDATISTIAQVEPVVEPALSTTSDNGAEYQQTMANLSSFLGSQLLRKKD